MAHRMRHYPAQLSVVSNRELPWRERWQVRLRFCCGRTDGKSGFEEGEAVMKLLQEIHQEGATICMVTHDPRFAAACGAGRSICSMAEVVAEGELNKLLAEVEA